MQTPYPDTYPVIQKKLKFSVTRCFFGHFKVESRVTSEASGHGSRPGFFEKKIEFFERFCFSKFSKNSLRKIRKKITYFLIQFSCNLVNSN
jgi:hypothetical protein